MLFIILMYWFARLGYISYILIANLSMRRVMVITCEMLTISLNPHIITKSSLCKMIQC